MADAKDKPTQEEAPAEKAGRRSPINMNANELRIRAAQVIWIICVLFALALAVGALTYALDLNDDNDLVGFVRDWANRVDLGVFTLENGIKEFTKGENAEIKSALFNWGLGAVFWLVLGRVLDRVIRP